MPYSSYSNYLEYKNCKKQSLPCYNRFDTYKKYNRSLNCTRAWWTKSTTNISVVDKNTHSGGGFLEELSNVDSSGSIIDISYNNLSDSIENENLELGKKEEIIHVNTTLKNYVLSNHCKCCTNPGCNLFDPKKELVHKNVFDPMLKKYCTALDSCCMHTKKHIL